MFVNEACKKSNLTKKAIEYYEGKGLISPEVLENGYRDYSEADILTLKEISVLRKCGISVADIKNILESKNKSAELAKCKYVTEIRLQRLQAVQHCMEKLIDNYDVEREFIYLQSHDEDLFTIKERLVLAFPGNYGMFLSLHFGRFLNEIIDTDEKRNAYNKIIDYLDSVDLYLPPEMSEYLEAFFAASEKLSAAQIEDETNGAMSEMLANTESYLEQHRKEIEEYLAYRESEEFRNSPAAKFRKMMQDFQEQSGYFEHLVGNIKILSSSYTDYLKNLEISDEKFLRTFPQAKDILT